jgi:PAS domain S-box-containing protein
MQLIDSLTDDIFAALPANYLLLAPNAPDFTIVACSRNYASATGMTKEILIGRNLFDVFPDNPNDKDITGSERLSQSLHRVIQTKTPDVMSITHYDVPGTSGDFMEKFWNPVNLPILNARGELLYILHSAEDTTEKLKKLHGDQLSKGFAEEQKRRFKKLILRAPIAVAILSGPRFIIESVNDRMCNHWGRTQDQLVNKPLHQAIPESRTDDFEKMLRKIFLTGEGHTSLKSRVLLERQGRKEWVWVDFVCEPLFDIFDNVESILVMAYETAAEPDPEV